jgi:protein-disulfide isomerase
VKASILGVALLLIALASPAGAQTPRCDSLGEKERAVAQAALASLHPYDCCDDTIDQCLKTRPDCRLVVRLADFVCRKAQEGKEGFEIGRALARRALSMVRPGKTHAIDLSAAPAAGAANAPVKLVAYLCVRCPYCARLIPRLYREVTTGRLANKVAFHVRLFPIKSHPGSLEANLAASVAGRLGRFWEFLLHAYAKFDHFDVETLPAWAEAVGLERSAFGHAMADPKERALLVASKKEGLRNGVDATPTLYLNGRKYLGDLDLETVVDVLAEEAEAR